MSILNRFADHRHLQKIRELEGQVDRLEERVLALKRIIEDQRRLNMARINDEVDRIVALVIKHQGPRHE